MARDLTAGMITEINASELKPLFLIKAEFDSGDLNFWSGYGDLVWGGDTYLGAGNLLSVDQISETQELVANGIKLSLSGIPSSVISLALTEPYQGRPLTIWFACMDDSNAVIADPYMSFKGRMDVMVLEDDGSDSRIDTTVENDLIGLRDSKERRYTDEDQKAEYPSDRGFEFVATAQDVTLTWGAGL